MRHNIFIASPHTESIKPTRTTMEDVDNGAGSNYKVTGIRQIVRLKEILHKWQHVTLGPKDDNHHHSSDDDHHELRRRRSNDDEAGRHGGISPAITRRLRSMMNNVYCDSDHEDGCNSPEPPHDVPKGYLAVYVGSELRRFIIPTSYLSDPLFKVLLEKVEEEFGFDHTGGLTIPCEIETFKYLLKCMENHQREQAAHQNATSETSSPIEE